MALATSRLYCASVYANIDKHQGFEDSLRRFVRERKIEGIWLLDSSEFEDFEHSVALIRPYRKDGALDIPKDSIVGRQVATMTSEDLRDRPEERFHAVMALNRVLGSFEAYPFHKNRPKGVSFSNIVGRNRTSSSWDGKYEEFQT